MSKRLEEIIGNVVAVIALLLFLFLMGQSLGHLIVERKVNDTITIVNESHTTDTIYKIDTIVVSKPKLVYVDRIKTIYVEDSVDVEQKVYCDSNYTAWVSGIDPELDSIRVYNHITSIFDTITIVRDNYITTNSKKKNWSLGVSAGYGVGNNGLSPFVGITLTRNLFRF